MPTSAYVVMAVLIVAVIAVFWMSSRNRIGGQPRRAMPTVPPSDTPTDPFADDAPLDSDPNMLALRSNSNIISNDGHHM